ncbi:MAG: acyltransferase [Niabella sp.]
MIKTIFSINWIFTILFNFRYLSFKHAVKLPIVFYGRVSMYSWKGKVAVPDRSGMATIQFGKPVVGLFDKKLATVLNIHGDLLFAGKATFGKGCSFSVGPGSTLSFGHSCTITAKSSIAASDRTEIIIGDHCLFSWDVLVMSTDFHKIIQEEEVINSSANIKIGNQVWIGARSLILKGSVIADGSVIGAGTLVNKKLTTERSVYAGVPAKELKGNILWQK